MIEIILFALTAFAVGFSGSLVPGPMLTVTIRDSLKKGFKAGPLVVFGHIIAELVLVALILAGFSWLIGSKTASIFIGTFGGLTLVLMGFQTVRSPAELPTSSEVEDPTQSYGSILGGFISSVSNPYFFIWWATIGCAFISKGLELAGILGVLTFFVGHWASDLGWYSFVSFFTGKGSEVINKHHYKLIMIVCGVFLIFLGIYFLLSAQKTI